MLLRLLVSLGLAAAALAQPANPERHARAIDAFLEQDRTAPPPRDAILFIGSSIFRQWSGLTAHMAPLPVFNRSFGGSQTHEILHYMDRIVLPYSPAIIVYYCGSNDINAGASAETIAANYRAFVERVHALFDSAGEPRLELYRKDLLHFEPPAYDAVAAIVRPVIEAAWNAR
jgi:hypothetical protein